MRVMVIGGGGREHALAWRLARSPEVEQVFVAPGNAGTAQEPALENLAIGEDIEALAAAARERAVDLTVVGPEAPLVAGIVDRFRNKGLRCLGPSAAAARLEGSKAFAKDFMHKHGIPTACHASFEALEPALEHLRGIDRPVVVKADGLAAGKGVIVAEDRAEAEAAVRDMLSGDAFGSAGRRVVIEERLQGEEVSFTALVDGQNAVALASSQDHKRRDDGDRGPNTGGMGALSPAPRVDAALHRRIMETIIEPTVRGMAAEDTPFTGFLYAGLMVDPAGEPKVLEFNVRLGDPEAQPLMMRLTGDLAGLCRAACDGALAGYAVDWDRRAALGVVLAAEGYPGAYAKGEPIAGLDEGDEGDDDTVKVFHAGTWRDDGRIVTSGGRVLCVCGLGDDLATAQRRAYRRIEGISWRGMCYRRDIGNRALAG